MRKIYIACAELCTIRFIFSDRMYLFFRGFLYSFGSLFLRRVIVYLLSMLRRLTSFLPLRTAWPVFLFSVACNSPAKQTVSRATAMIVIETTHANEEQANLPEPEKNRMPGTFIVKSFYDARHLVLKIEKWAQAETLEWLEEWAYDAAGNPIEYRKYHRDSLLEKKTQEFNASGKLLSGRKYNYDADVVEKKTVAYDAVGTRTETMYSDVNGEFVKSLESFYDSAGRLIESRYFILPADVSADSPSSPSIHNWLRQVTYQYDAQNNLIQSATLNMNLIMESITSYSYDSLRNPTSMIVHNPKKNRAQTYRYEYNYDSNGTWKRKKTFLNNHLMSVSVQRVVTSTDNLAK